MRDFRNQYEGDHDALSLDSGIDCSNLPDMARQEFKDEADTNWILSRFGVGQQRAVQFGEVDFDLDLQQAHALVQETNEAYEKLAPHLREKYANMQEVLNAIDSGELTTLEKPAPAVAEPAKASTSGDA